MSEETIVIPSEGSSMSRHDYELLFDKIPADLKDIDWKQEGSSFLDRDITIAANGVSKSVQLYMTDQRTLYGGTAGKGIASRAEIPAKSIIGLYCGRLIDFQPDDPTYCTRVGTTKFAMDASSLMGKLGVHTVNDNSAYHNVSALLCHVCVEDAVLPVIVYEASVDIRPFEFLSVAYEDDYWADPFACRPLVVADFETLLTDKEITKEGKLTLALQFFDKVSTKK
ncbi:hypothetical protein J8273_7657 [Carpediemonas membranifera]|uniref:Uncharacterized protein n=1 Tax=Carpediemonas membranifera TaxID=201153 RepID=A0A8J6B260_9EUKA|nr:hypothetical protein J8273_7657 [Carpediemonas membranifera]|eukprot:KAG9391289.1 hypothetical protein J8273_7657 [Carpediemonas membranifera]